MTQEDKELLLKDLCARLPYRVKCYNVETEEDFILSDVTDIDSGYPTFDYGYGELIGIKPYLRPLSSMTDEEKDWYETLRNALTYQENGEYDLDDFNELNDFLNRRKLDRYDLIEKGLALKAPEGMYKIE